MTESHLADGTNRHAPVVDWATDFDHTDSVWVDNPFPIWDQLRQVCPVAHSDRYGGTWLPTRHEDISAIAYDTEHFTSRGVVVEEGRPIEEAPIGGAPPITSDPPFHSFARRLLLPAFGPKVIAQLEPQIRTLCRGLLDAVDARRLAGEPVDASAHYAAHIPVDVIARMLGLPIGDEELFREFVHGVLENVAAPPDERDEFFGRLETYLDIQLQDHRDNPRDDLISYLLNVDIGGGERLPDEHVRGTVVLLLVAGIDTTWGAIGSSLWHLAQSPHDRRRLATEPDLWDTGVEELLRAYAPVTMARLVVDDFEFQGCPMKKDDWVLLPFPAGNRDPEVFDNADKVLLDRAQNRHSAFGLGIHRCIGSNLARLELRIALEEWMARFPDFELSGETVRFAPGQVRGPRELPVTIL